MPTTVLNIMSVAFPSITNRLKASVYLQSDPQALIASQIDSVSGHPARTWSFPGLPRNNYGFALDEIDGGGTLVNRIAFFDVVPSELDGSLNRDDEQIQVGTTPGLVAGVNTFTFDGTAGKPDYRGWTIVVSEYTGRVPMIEDALDFTWDKDTAIFTLLQVGDVFANSQWYNIHFNPQDNPAGNSYPTVTDFGIRLITSGNSLETDFGNKLLIEPDDVYIEVSLPAILTVPQGRKMMVEIGGVTRACVNFLSVDASINFLRGRIMAYPNESFSIYRFQRAVGNDEWRVCDEQGNFDTVGRNVSDDSIISNTFNCHLLDGESVETVRYARIYNEIVLNLPMGAVCNYDVWTTAGNRTKYSLDNSSNPSAAGHFHLPERLGYFEKNLDAGFAGQFNAEQVGPHTHPSLSAIKTAAHASSSTALGSQEIRFLVNTVASGGNGDATAIVVTNENDGDSNEPNNYLINKYVLI